MSFARMRYGCTAHHMTHDMIHDSCACACACDASFHHLMSSHRIASHRIACHPIPHDGAIACPCPLTLVCCIGRSLRHASTRRAHVHVRVHTRHMGAPRNQTHAAGETHTWTRTWTCGYGRRHDNTYPHRLAPHCVLCVCALCVCYRPFLCFPYVYPCVDSLHHEFGEGGHGHGHTDANVHETGDGAARVGHCMRMRMEGIMGHQHSWAPN